MWIAEVTDVEMGSAGFPEARAALVAAASGERGGVKVTNLLAALHAE
ncbi:hypothetical protein U879_00875 [Defluviimonas sp. 20V17]|nr:hypothetical protein U879_00875 [Defluviimonas sp. 20V17]